MSGLSATARALFRAIGISDLDGILPPIVEPDEDGTYVKFMSHHGERDAEQGDKFAGFLAQNMVKYRQLNSRSFTVDRDRLAEVVAATLLAPAPVDVPRVDDRFIFTIDFDVFPHCLVPMGTTGTIARIAPDLIAIRLDDVFPALAEWDNEVIFDLTRVGEDRDLAAEFLDVCRRFTAREYSKYPAPRRVPDLSILYACDGEHTERSGPMRLRELVDRFIESGVDPDEVSNLINGVAETGHHIGSHECGHYAAIQVDRDRRAAAAE